jgi:hypothetical protein
VKPTNGSIKLHKSSSSETPSTAAVKSTNSTRITQ